MDSKRLLRLAIAATLLLAMVSAVFAQSRFRPVGMPLQMRQTGVTETAGELLLIAMGPEPSPTIPAGTTLTISLLPSAATITNDPIINGTNLVIETPPDFTPMAVPGATLEVGTPENRLIITFSQTVPVPTSTRLRLRGVRLNAQASGIAFPGQIQVQLNASPPDAMLIEAVDVLNVATPLPAIAVSFPEPIATLLSCFRQTVTRRVVLTEQFSAAFTSQAQEARFSSTPSPTNPTRIEVQLRNVPGGLTVTPPPSAELRGGTSGEPPSLRLNTALSQMDRLMSAVTRDILLTYDIAGEPDLGTVERTLVPGEVGLGFDFTFTTTGLASTQSLGPAEIQVRLAPLSTTPARARASDPMDAPRRVLPRFIDPSIPTPARQLVGVVGCSCNMKFPFVTNKLGFDTGIVIANAGQDPYGTSSPPGAVTLYFYGQDAPTPPSLTTPVIPPGGSFTGLLSELAPDFQGYIIAVAGFQFCKGYVYIADSDFANIAHGYTALVIPDPVQLGRRVAGFVTSGIVNLGGTTGTITIQDALGERLLQ